MMKKFNCIQRWLVLWAMLHHAVLLPLYADPTVAGSVGKVTQAAGTIVNVANDILGDKVGNKLDPIVNGINNLNKGLAGNQINGGQGIACTPPQANINQLSLIKSQCDMIKEDANIRNLEDINKLLSDLNIVSANASPQKYLSCLRSKMEASENVLENFYVNFQNASQNMKAQLTAQLRQANYKKLVDTYKQSYDLLFGAVWKGQLPSDMKHCSAFMENSESNSGLSGLLDGKTYKEKIQRATKFQQDETTNLRLLNTAQGLAYSINFNDPSSIDTLKASIPSEFANSAAKLENLFKLANESKNALLNELKNTVGAEHFGTLNQFGNTKADTHRIVQQWVDKSMGKCINEQMGGMKGMLSQFKNNPKATAEINGKVTKLLDGSFDNESLVGFLDRNQSQLKKFTIRVTGKKNVKKNIYQYFKEQHDLCLKKSMTGGSQKSWEEASDIANQIGKKITSLNQRSSQEFNRNFKLLITECNSAEGVPTEYNSQNCFSSDNNWCFEREKNCQRLLTPCDEKLKFLKETSITNANHAVATATILAKKIQGGLEDFFKKQQQIYGTKISEIYQNFGLKLTQINLPTSKSESDIENFILKKRTSQNGVNAFIDIDELIESYITDFNQFSEDLKQQIAKNKQGNQVELQYQEKTYSGISNAIADAQKSCQEANNAGQKISRSVKRICYDLKQSYASLCDTKNDSDDASNVNSVLSDVLDYTHGRKITNICKSVTSIKRKAKDGVCKDDGVEELYGAADLLEIDIDSNCTEEQEKLNKCCVNEDSRCASTAMKFATCVEEEAFEQFEADEEESAQIATGCRELYNRLAPEAAGNRRNDRNNKDQNVRAK